MADKRDYKDDQLNLYQHSETGYEYWNHWYGYYPYGAVPRMSPQSQWSWAQCVSQLALSNPEDNDALETDSEDEHIDAPSSSQRVGGPGR